jgi:hypothetical protein
MKHIDKLHHTYKHLIRILQNEEEIRNSLVLDISKIDKYNNTDTKISAVIDGDRVMFTDKINPLNAISNFVNYVVDKRIQAFLEAQDELKKTKTEEEVIVDEKKEKLKQLFAEAGGNAAIRANKEDEILVDISTDL